VVFGAGASGNAWRGKGISAPVSSAFAVAVVLSGSSRRFIEVANFLRLAASFAT
jgi:hypothetical protein